jgi:hypothetical protein
MLLQIRHNFPADVFILQKVLAKGFFQGIHPDKSKAPLRKGALLKYMDTFLIA